MNETVILEVGREAIWVMFLISAPLLTVGLVIGLVIALMQALTSIQDSTLTFAPKVVAMLVTLLLALPFMMTTLIEFTQRLFDRIAQGG